MKNDKIYPQFPKDWNNPENIVCREFYFKSSPDLSCLIRLTKDNLTNKGNEGILKAKLLNILRSYESRLFFKNHLRHRYPKTYKIRMYFHLLKRYINRKFETKYFKGQVYLCGIANEVCEEIKAT